MKLFKKLFNPDMKVIGREQPDGRIFIDAKYESAVRNGTVKVSIVRCRKNKELVENASRELIESVCDGSRSLVSEIPYNWVFVENS